LLGDFAVMIGALNGKVRAAIIGGQSFVSQEDIFSPPAGE
jgi:hypothetical protein